MKKKLKAPSDQSLPEEGDDIMGEPENIRPEPTA